MGVSKFKAQNYTEALAETLCCKRFLTPGIDLCWKPCPRCPYLIAAKIEEAALNGGESNHA